MCTCVYTHMYIHVCVHVCVYTHMYICVYIHRCSIGPRCRWPIDTCNIRSTMHPERIREFPLYVVQHPRKFWRRLPPRPEKAKRSVLQITINRVPEPQQASTSISLTFSQAHWCILALLQLLNATRVILFLSHFFRLATSLS